MKALTLEILKQAIQEKAPALRCVTEYQPSGGPGDKIFPATYEGGKYAVETRLIEGQLVNCVLIDSVQSQANRMELALLEAVRDKRIELPILEVRFDDKSLLKPFSVTSLEAPHRIADAIFRDSCIKAGDQNIMFRKSAKGKMLENSDLYKATGLFGLCPTALVFGIWDSTGPRGGLGVKVQRAIVSEIIGYHAELGVKTSSRIDPLQIKLGAGPVLTRSEKTDQDPDWMIAEVNKTSDKGKTAKNKEGKRPSEVNHGNITPSITDGGFTISKALQTTVISLTAIRRLRFPLESQTDSNSATDLAARVVLAALGLLAAVLTREEGADLRSRCQLIPTQAFLWEIIDKPGQTPSTYTVDAKAAVELFRDSLKEAREAGLPWDGTITLTPHPDLVELVRRSQVLESQRVAEAE